MVRFSRNVVEVVETPVQVSPTCRGVLAIILVWLVVASIGCANLDEALTDSRADVLILTTDRETTSQLLDRIRDVERLADSSVETGSWFRGHVPRAQDGSLYTIVVGYNEKPNDETIEAMIRRGIEVRRPRYLLSIGKATAVAYERPLGAIGVVKLVCDFELEAYESHRDLGDCYRSDGGLVAAALVLAPEWESAGRTTETRHECDPPRVEKMSALFGDPGSSPRFVDVVTGISEAAHRGLVINRFGAAATRTIASLRRELREPMGFLMIVTVSDVLGPSGTAGELSEASAQEHRPDRMACAASDSADFAVELIRERWPVLPRAMQGR